MRFATCRVRGTSRTIPCAGLRQFRTAQLTRTAGDLAPSALALRDLVEEAVKLAGDLLDPAHETFPSPLGGHGQYRSRGPRDGEGPLAPLAGLSATGRHGRDCCLHEPHRPWKAPDEKLTAAPVATRLLGGIDPDHPAAVAAACASGSRSRSVSPDQATGATHVDVPCGHTSAGSGIWAGVPP